MTSPALVWLVVGLATTAILLIVVAALVRQGILLARTVMRFGREASAVSQGIGAAGRARDPRR